jgi:UDP-glucuronate decarboxylase
MEPNREHGPQGPRQLILTGASGWIGRNVLEMAHGGAETRGDWVISAFGNGPGSVHLTTGARHTLAPIANMEGLAVQSGALLIHAGFPTQDRVETLGVKQYTTATNSLRYSLTRLIASSPPIDVIYISSGAAARVAEGIAVDQRTRVYGEAKLADEEALKKAVSEARGRLCIVRAFALSGRYMTKPETYALGDMILQAQASGRIDIRADHLVRRSYMAIADMVALARGSFPDIEPGLSFTFDTAGEVVEMTDLAERILTTLDQDPTATCRTRLRPDAPPDDYLGDSDPVCRLASRLLIAPQRLEEQIAETAHWLRQAGGRT